MSCLRHRRPQRIVLVGPGAIGCLFAGLAARAGAEVWLLDKRPDRAARLDRQGVVLREPEGRAVFAVHAVADPARLPEPDWICFCVKAFDTAAAVRHAAPLLARSGAVVSLQNGLDNGKHFAAAGVARLVCATTGQGATLLAEGDVLHAGSGVTAAAPLQPEARSDAERFSAGLGRLGIPSRFAPDAPSLLWSKAVVNAAINPVTAIWRVRNGAVLQEPALRSRMLQAAAEGEAVARSAGIPLLYPDARPEVERVCRETADNKSSMLQDLEKGRQTEIEAINGEIVQEAARRAVAVPTLAHLLQRVRELSRPSAGADRG